MTFKAALLLMSAGVVPVAAQESDWKIASPDYQWDFPEDHWAHDGFKSEWWYFTGHLATETDEEPRFGFQFTFFKVGLTPTQPELQSRWATRDMIMGHLAITDHETGEHHFSEVLYRAMPQLGGFGDYPDSLIAWSLGPPGSFARWYLLWNGAAFDLNASDDQKGIGLSLSTRPERPIMFQGPSGYSRKSDGESSASLYYSFTRLASHGEVTLNDTTYAVTGLSWMDKEFGSNQLTADQVGWDWFSLQLSDGTDVMLFELRDSTGAPTFRSATTAAAPNPPEYLSPSDWTLAGTDSWSSEYTGAEYPVAWTLGLPGRTITLRAATNSQENVSELVDLLYYWEGAVIVYDEEGNTIGRGYAEMTGYGDSISPAI